MKILVLVLSFLSFSGINDISFLELNQLDEVSSMKMDCHQKKENPQKEKKECKKMECCVLSYFSLSLNKISSPISFSYLKRYLFVENKILKEYQKSIFRPPIA